MNLIGAAARKANHQFVAGDVVPNHTRARLGAIAGV
jgi:hypothetical protein